MEKSFDVFLPDLKLCTTMTMSDLSENILLVEFPEIEEKYKIRLAYNGSYTWKFLKTKVETNRRNAQEFILSRCGEVSGLNDWFAKCVRKFPAWKI